MMILVIAERKLEAPMSDRQITCTIFMHVVIFQNVV